MHWTGAINHDKIKKVKKVIKTKHILQLVFFCMPLLLNAQKTDKINQSKIQVLARVSMQKVTLRWAPDNANAWLLGNKFGYMIERYTFLKNRKTTAKQTKVILTSTPIKPWPLENWRTMADTSDFAAIAAQAIYGNDFELDLNKKNDISAIFNKTKEIESRFTFALHAANQAQLVANASGLFFVDTTTRNNESYLYRIYIATPQGLMKVDTGIIFVDAGRPDKLPKLREVSVSSSGNVVLVNWTISRYEKDYVAYKVERSDDSGKSFHALSNIPFVNLGSQEIDMPERALYRDSIPQFNVPYYYRVRGLTSFAETGPPSDSVKIIAQKLLYNPPSIRSGEIVSGKVILKWEMRNKKTDAIKGFQVERASALQGNYTRLNRVVLSPSDSAFMDTTPKPSNYYRVVALDKKGAQYTSLPYFVQLEDSIPPMSPVGLKGEIDSTGLVKLIWKNNMEDDLLGYRVYRSYFLNSEFVQVVPNPFKNNTFSEKIKLKNLNKYLYYKITASDTHQNQSGFSTIIRIKQPDIIPPSAPAISSVTATSQGIKISMIPSGSDDVEKYVVYRKEVSDSIWALEKVMPFEIGSFDFTDSTTVFGSIYAYNVLAVDSAGNESIPARSIRCKALNQSISSAILIEVNKDMEKKAIEIKWSTSRAGAVSVIIYKATGEEPIAQYVTYSADGGLFWDEEVKLTKTYRYMVKMVYADGSESGFSNVVMINY